MTSILHSQVMNRRVVIEDDMYIMLITYVKMKIMKGSKDHP